MCPTKLHPSQIHADLPGIFEEHVHLRLPYHYAVVKVQGGMLPRHQQPNLTKVTSQCQPGGSDSPVKNFRTPAFDCRVVLPRSPCPVLPQECCNLLMSALFGECQKGLSLKILPLEIGRSMLEEPADDFSVPLAYGVT